MQCRYCLGDDRSDSMVTPCRCRGTSQFTHPECLTRYFAYYPDRMCRVCNSPLEYGTVLDRVLPLAFLAAFLTLLLKAGPPPLIGILFVVGYSGLFGVLVTYPVLARGLVGEGLVVGVLVAHLHVDPLITLYYLGGMGIFMWLQTVRQFIPDMMMLVFLTCTLVVAYLVLFMMSAVQNLNAIASAVLVVLLYLSWKSVLALRPGHGFIRIHNE